MWYSETLTSHSHVALLSVVSLCDRSFHYQGSGGTASFGSGGGDGPISGSSEAAENDNGVGEPATFMGKKY